MDNRNELFHYGILGMKWGVRRKSQDGSGGSKKSRTEKKEESIEAKKERILKSKSAKEIYKNRDLFDDKELAAAYNRLNMEKNIKSLVPAEKSRGQKYIDEYVKTSTNVDSLITSTTKLYGNYKKVSKFISDRASAATS